jgi:hypothetical protein
MCAEIPIAFQKEGQLILISGRFIPNCKKNYSGYGLQTQYFDFSEIKGIDSLYNSGSFTIKIIKTENFGNSPGFGYEIFDSEKNFRITQKEIPAQAGTEPFKTKEDALKIGYLVAYKLKNFDDFPSVYLGELFFLKIIDDQ